MRNMGIVILFLLSVTGSLATAKVYGPSVQELQFSYQAEFVTEDLDSSNEDLAVEHAQYLFGLMHSPKLVKSYGLNPELVGGIGALRFPVTITRVAREKLDGQSVLIRYSVRGAILLHQKVANKILKDGGLPLPMPYQLSQIYDRKCTDEHYTSEGDYWYFYDVFRAGCTYLKKDPYAKTVNVRIFNSTANRQDPNPRLDLLRGNNGNGDEFTVDIIHGFSESSKSRNDDGRLSFREVNEELVRRGFSEVVEKSYSTRPQHRFTKSIQLENGKNIQIVIRHLLVDTAIDSRNISFARFFKDAVENSDVVIYSGHSGLGGNLDIESLEAKVGEFRFNAAKRQIFYFDSCSSYSYYLKAFESMKSKSRLDILTNGLSSYFHTGTLTMMAFLDVFLDPDNSESWDEILTRVESVLDGGSYLLNVGAI